MKFFSTILLTFVFASSSIFSQFGIGEMIKKKIEKKVEEKTEEAIDKTLEGKHDNSNDDENDDDAKSSTKKIDNTKNTIQNETPSLSSYSKFDFIPGERIIFFDDFSQDAVGDFPSKWDTDGSGEVVTTNLYPGKWFKIINNGNYVPDIKSPLPENFTIEFDVIGNFQLDYPEERACTFEVDIVSLYDYGNKFDHHYLVQVLNDLIFTGETSNTIRSYKPGATNIDNHITGSWLNNFHKKVFHISISVNKTRFRYWINQTKVFDLPRIIPANTAIDLIRLSPYYIEVERDYDLLISNFKVAEGTIDTRSKLLTEGKLVTNAITFDSGSDKIKLESYPTIKSIAEVLSSNQDVKVMIVGHTDSDGNAASNQTLSEKRALAVKNILVNEFKISESRIQTSGKGDSMPIAENNTAIGKAQNRRVEFIKL